jgi:hypothetical protein
MTPEQREPGPEEREDAPDEEQDEDEPIKEGWVY